MRLRPWLAVRLRHRRRAAIALGLAACLVVGLAGCDRTVPPNKISTDGGFACQAVELDNVAARLGVRFDTSAGANVDLTYTCVLAQLAAAYPNLTLSMSKSAANVVIFQVTALPAGATDVKDLGRVAYQITVPAGTDGDGTKTGPTVEIGWLSAAPQQLVMRYTFASAATDADVTTMTPKLLDLAHDIEHMLLVGPTLT
jgi:hypothetical protein